MDNKNDNIFVKQIIKPKVLINLINIQVFGFLKSLVCKSEINKQSY